MEQEKIGVGAKLEYSLLGLAVICLGAVSLYFVFDTTAYMAYRSTKLEAVTLPAMSSSDWTVECYLKNGLDRFQFGHSFKSEKDFPGLENFTMLDTNTRWCGKDEKEAKDFYAVGVNRKAKK